MAQLHRPVLEILKKLNTHLPYDLDIPRMVFTKINISIHTHKGSDTNVHSFIGNSQKLERTQMAIKRRMDKQVVIYQQGNTTQQKKGMHH